MREHAVDKWGHSHHFAIDTGQSEKKSSYRICNHNADYGVGNSRWDLFWFNGTVG